MKYKYSLRMKRIISVTSASVLCLTGVLGVATKGFTVWDPDEWFKYFSKENDVFENGINVKLLSSVANEDGTVTKIISYSVKPQNANNQDVSVTAKFADGGDCSDIISVSANPATHEITVKCLKAFDRKITLTIVSKANNSATATVNIDYVKKVLSLVSANKVNKQAVYYMGNNWIESGTPINNFSPTEFIIPTYSLFTKDKTYSFEIKNIEVIPYDICIGYDSEDQNTVDRAVSGMQNLIQSRLQNHGQTYTADEIWNLDNSNEWHSIVKYNSVLNPDDDTYLGFKIKATFYCAEAKEVSLDFEEEIYCSIAFDYSNEKYSIGVSGLVVGNENIEF